MAFCQNCGSVVDGRFCAKCGTPIGTEAGAPSGSSTVPPSGPAASALTDNVAGALAYIPIVGIIFLLIEPYSHNKAVRFHAFQGLFLVVAYIVVQIVTSTVASVLWGLDLVLRLIHLAFVGLWLYLMYQTYLGKKIVLPIIGPIAEKQA